MNIAKIIKVLTLLFLFSEPLLFLNSAEAKLIVKTVEYRDGDSVLEGKVAGSFKNNLPLLRKRTDLAVQELKKMKEVDPQNLAAMGYCFGGTSALELARSGANLKGFISFHGGLSTPSPQDAKNIKGEILVFTGADDPHVPPTEVMAFQKEMQDAHVSHWEVVSYSNAVHAFTNPDSGNDHSKGAAYNAEADHKSWEAMKLFLNRIFKTGKVSS